MVRVHHRRMDRDDKDKLRRNAFSAWIGMSQWIEFYCDNWRGKFIGLPTCAGCYVVIGDGRCVYVGSTENLKNRFAAHQSNSCWPLLDIHTNWGKFSFLKIKFKPSRKLGDWLMIEFRLIRRLKPEFNYRGLKNKETASV